MAKIRNSEGDAFLVDANGDFYDSSMAEDDGDVPPSETAAANAGFGDVEEVIADFFPELDLETGIFTFEDD